MVAALSVGRVMVAALSVGRVIVAALSVGRVMVAALPVGRVMVVALPVGRVVALSVGRAARRPGVTVQGGMFRRRGSSSDHSLTMATRHATARRPV